MAAAIKPRRKPATDPVLSAAIERARETLLAETPADSIGEHEAFVLEEERLGTHYFVCKLPGYLGWHWAVTLARPPRARTATVCEVNLLPGEGALLAKEWVPWADRLAPGDVGTHDRLPYQADDSRLESGYLATGDPEMDRIAIQELALDRTRVVTRQTLDSAATRWYEGESGPNNSGSRAAGADCSTCGFLVPISGHLGKLFGVCVNEWSPQDGKVVSYDHGCGAHSETDQPRKPSMWNQPEPVIDEFDLEIIATDDSNADTSSADSAGQTAGTDGESS